MVTSRLKIIKAPRPVPNLAEGSVYTPEVINGKEYIVDGYGGKLPVSDAKLCEVVIERV